MYPEDKYCITNLTPQGKMSDTLKIAGGNFFSEKQKQNKITRDFISLGN